MSGVPFQGASSPLQRRRRMSAPAVGKRKGWQRFEIPAPQRHVGISTSMRKQRVFRRCGPGKPNCPLHRQPADRVGQGLVGGRDSSCADVTRFGPVFADPDKDVAKTAAIGAARQAAKSRSKMIASATCVVVQVLDARQPPRCTDKFTLGYNTDEWRLLQRVQHLTRLAVDLEPRKAGRHPHRAPRGFGQPCFIGGTEGQALLRMAGAVRV